MKTLVYFASGHIKDEYQELDFDKIYLIDNCFRHRWSTYDNAFTEGKITCLGMDCLHSIRFLKRENVKIDYFVSLNEGLYEGGGSYPINSDMFLGYVMPLLKDEYIHIMNKHYYGWQYRVTMDLPYQKEEIFEGDTRFLSPFIFSEDNYHKGYAKVFQMTKIKNNRFIVPINPKIHFEIIHDSIWNYYNQLDSIALQFTKQGQGDFFSKHHKIISNVAINIFDYCEENKINKIGFTPWTGGDYSFFTEKIKNFKGNYPKEIYFFHLNKDDYSRIKREFPNNS